MKLIRTVSDMQKFSLDCKRKNQTIGFVPTMGSLHEGHLSLIRLAKKRSDIVVVSIFVNPLQFGKGEDFDKYPRNLDRDAELLHKEGVDVLFYPSVDEMYPDGKILTEVYVNKISEILCGKYREGHFKGVTTVVSKLFNIVMPDIAVFGKKDRQQLFIIKKMVNDLNFNIKIIEGEIIREKDGLAMSSRNSYLLDEERESALMIYKGLKNSVDTLKKTKDVEKTKKEFIKYVESSPLNSVQYIEVVNSKDFSIVEEVDRDLYYILTAVFVGNTRLIDNMEVEIE